MVVDVITQIQVILLMFAILFLFKAMWSFSFSDFPRWIKKGLRYIFNKNEYDEIYMGKENDILPK